MAKLVGFVALFAAGLLLAGGLAATGVAAGAGVKSSNYGVFSGGTDGHKGAKETPEAE